MIQRNLTNFYSKQSATISMSPQEREAWEREKRHPLIGALLGGLTGAGLSAGATGLLNQRVGPETGIAAGAGGLLGALLGGLSQYSENRDLDAMLEQAFIEAQDEMNPHLQAEKQSANSPYAATRQLFQQQCYG